MNLSIDDQLQATNFSAAVAAAGLDNAAPKPRKARAPRKTAFAREIEAYQEGFTAGVESTEGGGLISIICGGIGGAGMMAIIWAVVHFV